MSTRPVTALDFDALKADLISYISSNPTYSDYNFEGSALNTIFDVLAYNTHSNAYYANMLHSESFLDSAQKRSSVVSKAKELGYTPKSAACSTAFVTITTTGDTVNSYLTLPRGTSFDASNDNGTYQFIVAETVVSTPTNNTQLFSNVKLVNGKLVSNYFTVDTLTNVRSIFSIPNTNIDTTTLKVYVRDSNSAVERKEYILSKDGFNLDSTSQSYFLQESYDGFFQIYFGGGVLGIQPVSGNVIDIEYIVTTEYDGADGCRTFNFDGTIGYSTSINIATTQVSFGGSDKELIDSIKNNAKKTNTAKSRVVSDSDYAIFLKNEFNFIKSVSVWGGEDNEPPVYGKVFLSIQPISGYTISDTIKSDVITPAIRKNSMMTTSPVYVDPAYLILEFSSNIKFNQANTTLLQSDIISGVQNIISTYVSSISEFNVDYLESTLVNKISSYDTGIVSVSLDKSIGFRLRPLIGVSVSHSNSVNNRIVQGSVRSTKFNILRDTVIAVSIKEITGSFSTTVNSDGSSSIIQTVGMYSDGILIESIGTVNLTTGVFSLLFDVYSYISSISFIQVMCSLAEDDVITAREQILYLPTSVADSTIGLSENNTVTIELYGK